jgi:hypothetical protein
MENIKINGTITINNVELMNEFHRINRNLLMVNKRVGIFEELLPRIIQYKNERINEIIDNFSLNSSYDCLAKIFVYKEKLNKDLEEELVKEFDNILNVIEDIVKKKLEKYKESTVNFSDEQKTRERKSYKAIEQITNELTQSKELNIRIIRYFKKIIETNDHNLEIS